MGLPLAISRLAARQHAAIAVRQLGESGISSSTVSSWVEAGWFRRCQPGVVAIAGSPDTYEQRLAAALLAAGGGGWR